MRTPARTCIMGDNQSRRPPRVRALVQRRLQAAARELSGYDMKSWILTRTGGMVWQMSGVTRVTEDFNHLLSMQTWRRLGVGSTWRRRVRCLNRRCDPTSFPILRDMRDAWMPIGKASLSVVLPNRRIGGFATRGVTLEASAAHRHEAQHRSTWKTAASMTAVTVHRGVRQTLLWYKENCEPLDGQQIECTGRGGPEAPHPGEAWFRNGRQTGATLNRCNADRGLLSS